jgi:ferredoxin
MSRPTEVQSSMAYVVTDACIKDFLCVSECTTAAIAPAKENPAAATVSQVYINPDECIDCGSCSTICEHDAIFNQDELPAEKAQCAGANRAYFQ